MTITSKIDFYQIRIPSLAEINYLRSRDLFKRSSVIFDRYRSAAPGAKHASSAPAPAEKASKPASAPESAGRSLVVVTEEPEEKDEERRVVKKKLKKFKDNPRRFFQDSNNFVVRKIGNLMGYKNE